MTITDHFPHRPIISRASELLDRPAQDFQYTPTELLTEWRGLVAKEVEEALATMRRISAVAGDRAPTRAQSVDFEEANQRAREYGELREVISNVLVSRAGSGVLDEGASPAGYGPTVPASTAAANHSGAGSPSRVTSVPAGWPSRTATAGHSGRCRCASR